MATIDYNYAANLYVRSGSQLLKEWWNDNIFASMLRGEIETEPKQVTIPDNIYIDAEEKYNAKIDEEYRLQRTAHLNTLGIQYEKMGQVQKAIEVYEQCAEIGYPATHCYERLRILYRRQGDYEKARLIQEKEREICG